MLGSLVFVMAPALSTIFPEGIVRVECSLQCYAGAECRRAGIVTTVPPTLQ
jgi:hypothetical protein